MLGAWLDLSFTAMKSGIETQIAVMNALVRIPPVAAALRQHAMFNGMALAYLAPERIGRPDAA